MKRLQLLVTYGVASAVAWTWLGEPNVLATESSERMPTAVANLLQQEAEGQQVNRRQLISNATELDPETAWHAGFLQVDGEWVAVEELDGSDALSEYAAKRSELESQADPLMHLKLARWCTRNKLRQQARAHYFAIISRAPDHLEARQALEQVSVGGRWFSKQQISDARQQAESTLQDLERWTAELRGIAQLLSSPNAKASQKAFTKLDAIDDPAAVGALELFATNVDDDLARPLIAKLASFRSQEACLALVRIALKSSSLEIQQLTVKSIRTYPDVMYIPELLDVLTTEMQFESDLEVRPNGYLALHTLVGRELHGEKMVKRFSKVASVASRFSSTAIAGLDETQTSETALFLENTGELQAVNRQRGTFDAGTGASSYAASYVPPEVASATISNLRTEAAQLQRNVDRKNRENARVTHDICALLRALTDEDIGDAPERWWTWWSNRYERNEGEKPVVQYANVDRRHLELDTHRYAVSRPGYDRDLGRRSLRVPNAPTPRGGFRPPFSRNPTQFASSCLIPGTLVQTADGLRAVEDVKVGDLVPSQNIQTGELELKPVIATTLGPPQETIKITTAGSEIRATGGHLWWVSGSGWLKARDLVPGMLLRTATTTSKIENVELIKSPKHTHNLVVDEFHTYFVGDERLLSYDVTFVAPTLRLAPGFGILAQK